MKNFWMMVVIMGAWLPGCLDVEKGPTLQAKDDAQGALNLEEDVRSYIGNKQDDFVPDATSLSDAGPEPECACEETEKLFCQDGTWSHVYYGCNLGGICVVLTSTNGQCPTGECGGDLCTEPECTADEGCDDEDACTIDTCDPQTSECMHEPLPDTDGDGLCDELDPCEGPEWIQDTDNDGVCRAEDACWFDSTYSNSETCSVSLMCWTVEGCEDGPPWAPSVWSYSDHAEAPPACTWSDGSDSGQFPTSTLCCITQEVAPGAKCLDSIQQALGLPTGSFDAYTYFVEEVE